MPSHPGATQAHNMWVGLQNLNGNLLCAVDVETTGLDFDKHEIWQLCVLPLNAMLKPHPDFMPFYMQMRPDDISNIDPNAIKLSTKNLGELLLKAFPTDKVQDMFVEWYDKLPLIPGKKLVPLAHNWFFDKTMLSKWLGPKLMDTIFHYHARDTMIIGAFLNDRSDASGEATPYTRLGLKNMCSKHSITNANAHDAMSDCMATAELYEVLCRHHGIF